MKISAFKQVVASALALCLVFCCGCKDKKLEEPESTFEVETDPEMQYIRYDYDICDEVLVDERYGMCYNITGTGMLRGDGMGIMAGYRVEYKEAELIELLNWQIKRGVQCVESYRSDGFTFAYSVADKHDTLVLDLCVAGALGELRAEPVITEVGDGRIAVDFYYGARMATTDDNYGVLFLIEIPVDYYTDVDVNWIPVEGWMTHSDPMANGG